MSSIAESSTSASTSSTQLPPIQKGASLVIAYRLNERPVLLVGGGLIASGRLFYLLEAGAKVTIVSPRPLHPDIAARLETNPDEVTWHPRPYDPEDDVLRVENYSMVLTAIDDVEVSRKICDKCREKRVPINVADIPPSCDFYFGAQLRRGPLQVLVSTGGSGPKVGAMVRDIIEDALPLNLEEAIEGVGLLRADLRARAKGVGGEVGRKRMKWMIGICDSWGLEAMASLRDESIRGKVLDQGWERGEVVVRPTDVGVGSGRMGAWLTRWMSRDWSDVGWVAAGLGGFVSGSALGLVGAAWLLRAKSR